MKYFAKYIPVEGEIHDGDMIINSSGQIFKCTWEPKESTTKKVKLFLCSRDFKDGDIVISKFGGWKEKKAVEKDGVVGWINESTNSHLYFSPDDYKVIGEVSSEATWVKEGDEFDDNEVAVFISNKWVPYDCIPEDTWDVFDKELEFGIGIKGPCGHFH